jgi:hypothetical protein
MLLAALADPDPRLRDMLKRSKITVALCVEGEKSGAIAEKLKTDKTVVTPYRVCRACRKVAEVERFVSSSIVVFLFCFFFSPESFNLFRMQEGVVLQRGGTAARLVHTQDHM